MKKIITLALAVFMLLSMTTVAYAALPSTGSITIDGYLPENTYTIYKMLHLHGHVAADEAYTYTIEPGWETFFNTTAAAYVSVDDKGFVTWIGDADESDYADFAKLALEYARVPANGIVAVKSSADYPTSAPFTGTFEDLTLGYYLVDSTMGALCGLTTNAPDATIEAKNGAPVLRKQVYEDGNSMWNDTIGTADIGEVVKFRVIIEVHDGAENYVFHDEMTAGLELVAGSVKAQHLKSGATDPQDVPSTYYTYVPDPTDDCDFEIIFNEDFANHIHTDDEVHITYEAKVTAAAVAGVANTNSAWLDFGENHHTTPDTADVFTYGFDLIKLDGNRKLLDGAGFRIYDAETGGNEIFVEAIIEDGKTVGYRRNQELTSGVEISVTKGHIRVEGLDNGIYGLEETTNPGGYSPLTKRQQFTISSGNLNASFATDAGGNVIVDANGMKTHTSGGVTVVNQKGNRLPETGAMGRTIFISFGMVVMLGTGLLLVTKKRMSMIED